MWRRMLTVMIKTSFASLINNEMLLMRMLESFYQQPESNFNQFKISGNEIIATSSKDKTIPGKKYSFGTNSFGLLTLKTLSDENLKYVFQNSLSTKNLEKLDISGNNLPFLSNFFQTCKNLIEFDASNNNFGTYGMDSLSEKNFSETNLFEIISNFQNLKKLNLSSTKLSYFAAIKLENLESLDLSGNGLIYFGGDFNENFPKLKNLNISNKENIGCVIPEFIKDLRDLESLDISKNDLSTENAKTELEFIKNLTKLKALNLSSTNLVGDLDFIKNLKDLEFLDLSNNNLESLPEFIANFNKLKVLKIAGNKFEVIPNWIQNLKDLEELDISNNQLKFMCGLGNKLKKLNLSSTNLVGDLDFIKNLKDLEFLDLSNNNLESLPEFIANFNKLKVLKIAGNKFMTGKADENDKNLNEIVKILLKLPELETIDLSYNNITYLPSKFKGLKSIININLKNTDKKNDKTRPKFLIHTFDKNKLGMIDLVRKYGNNVKFDDVSIESNGLSRKMILKKLREERLCWNFKNLNTLLLKNSNRNQKISNYQGFIQCLQIIAGNELFYEDIGKITKIIEKLQEIYGLESKYGGDVMAMYMNIQETLLSEIMNYVFHSYRDYSPILEIKNVIDLLYNATKKNYLETRIFDMLRIFVDHALTISDDDANFGLEITSKQIEFTKHVIYILKRGIFEITAESIYDKRLFDFKQKYKNSIINEQKYFEDSVKELKDLLQNSFTTSENQTKTHALEMDHHIYFLNTFYQYFTPEYIIEILADNINYYYKKEMSNDSIENLLVAMGIIERKDENALTEDDTEFEDDNKKSPNSYKYDENHFKPCGLMNQNQKVCFFNVLIQCLLSLPEFVKFFADYEFDQKKQPLCYVFKKLINSYAEISSKENYLTKDCYDELYFLTSVPSSCSIALDSKEFLDIIKSKMTKEFSDDQQHDSGEFLGELMKSLYIECQYNAEGDSNNEKIFNEFKRLLCISDPSKSENDCDILQLIMIDSNKTIQDAINCSLESDSCLNKLRFISNISPKYLMINSNQNIDSNIRNQQPDDIIKINGVKYKNVGIVSYYGVIENGHYISFCERNNWIVFNDSSFKILKNKNEILRYAEFIPYVLFYSKVEEENNN